MLCEQIISMYVNSFNNLCMDVMWSYYHRPYFHLRNLRTLKVKQLTQIPYVISVKARTPELQGRMDLPPALSSHYCVKSKTYKLLDLG